MGPPDMPFHHRAGSLKQSNKKHKARSHLTSKRSIKLKLGGKVNATSAPNRRPGNKQKTVERDLKQDRLNRAKQLKEQRRNELFLQRRIGSTDAPTRVIALVGLSVFSDTSAVLQSIMQAADSTSPSPLGYAVSASFASSKQRFTCLTPAFRMEDVSEAAKVADLVIFVLNVAHGEESCITQEGDLIISILRSQGFPGAAGIIQGLKELSPKHQADMRRYGNRFFTTEFGDKVKVAEGDNQVQVLRVLTTASGQSVHWRSLRGYVMADSIEWEEQQQASQAGQPTQVTTLKMTGYVRGKPMNVNHLVHLPGIGTFQLSKICKATGEPCPLNKGAGSRGGSAMVLEKGEEVLATADPSKQESLEMMAEANDMEGEQTWPTEEELAEAAAAGAGTAGTDKRKQILKKKMGDYQASWFLDMDDDDLDDFQDEEDEDEERGEDGEEEGAAPLKGGASTATKGKEGIKSSNAGEALDSREGEEDQDDDDDDDDDAMTLNDLSSLATGGPKPRRELKAKEGEELEFPDEVDTPEDVAARQRFARYRALKSFRTSPWDPKESLPRSYSRIYSFQSFPRAQARVLAQLEEVERRHNKVLLDSMTSRSRSGSKSAGPSSSSVDKMEVEEGEEEELEEDDVQMKEAEGEGEDEEEDEEDDDDRMGPVEEGYVPCGTYVTLHIPGVPLAALEERCRWAPLLAFSLHHYENKVSLLHFNIQRHPTFQGPLPSKEELIFSTGFRSFQARPVFSENNLNCDKHKFSRFLHHGRFTVASVFGPVTMMPCPVLVFKQTRDETTGVVTKTELVATGALLSVDPDRIVLKKIVLSGYPVKVKKLGAVVKHMFYNPDDVRWFKPAELYTKQGAVGHIKEPVGTHGLMKVRFNKVIKQSDTVCLALYKRVYPKFMNEEEPRVVCL